MFSWNAFSKYEANISPVFFIRCEFITPRIQSLLLSSPAGSLPLSFCWQSFVHPLTVCRCIIPRHMHHWVLHTIWKWGTKYSVSLDLTSDNPVTTEDFIADWEHYQSNTSWNTHPMALPSHLCIPKPKTETKEQEAVDVMIHRTRNIWVWSFRVPPVCTLNGDPPRSGSNSILQGGPDFIR